MGSVNQKLKSWTNQLNLTPSKVLEHNQTVIESELLNSFKELRRPTATVVYIHFSLELIFCSRQYIKEISYQNGKL